MKTADHRNPGDPDAREGCLEYRQTGAETKFWMNPKADGLFLTAKIPLLENPRRRMQDQRMRLAGRTKHRLDVIDWEHCRHGTHSNAGSLAANNFHHRNTTRERQLLLIAQRPHQQTLQGRQRLMARLVQQVTDKMPVTGRQATV